MTFESFTPNLLALCQPSLSHFVWKYSFKNNLLNNKNNYS